MHDCLIAFGSNEGNSTQIFGQAVKRIGEITEINVLASSRPLQTDPVGGPDGQASYLNAAIRIQTSLGAQELHRELVKVENDLGRKRRQRWGSRKIDLDLLLYGRLELETKSLTLPHPRMSFRRFVLQPASEIASDMVHASSGQTIEQLLAALDQPENLVLFVSKLEFSTAELAAAELVKHEAQIQGLLPAEWRLEIVSDQQQLEQKGRLAKLVCFVGQPGHVQRGLGSPLIQAAVSFPGPTLRLSEDLEKSKMEIKAAFEAIKPLPGNGVS